MNLASTDAYIYKSIPLPLSRVCSFAEIQNGNMADRLHTFYVGLKIEQLYEILEKKLIVGVPLWS